MTILLVLECQILSVGILRIGVWDNILKALKIAMAYIFLHQQITCYKLIIENINHKKNEDSYIKGCCDIPSHTHL